MKFTLKDYQDEAVADVLDRLAARGFDAPRLAGYPR